MRWRESSVRVTHVTWLFSPGQQHAQRAVTSLTAYCRGREHPQNGLGFEF
jgi:hypothetical protein